MRSIDSTFGMLFIFLMLFILHVRYSAATKDGAQNTQDLEIDEKQDDSIETLKWEAPFHGGLNGEPLECENVGAMQSELLQYKNAWKENHDALIKWLEEIPKEYEVHIPEEGLDMTSPLTWLFEKEFQATLFKAVPPATIKMFREMEKYEKKYTYIFSTLNMYFQTVAKVAQQDAGVLLNYYPCKASTFQFQFHPSIFSLTVQLPASYEACKDLIEDTHLPEGLSTSKTDGMTHEKEHEIQSNFKNLVENYFGHRHMSLTFFIIKHWLTICSFRSPSLSKWILKETKSVPITHPEATNSRDIEKIPSVSSTMAMPKELDLSQVLSLPFTPTFSIQLEQKVLVFYIIEKPSHFVCGTKVKFQLQSVETRLRSIFNRLFTSFLPHSLIDIFIEKFSSEISVEKSLHWITDKEFFQAFYSSLPIELAPFLQELEKRRERITETMEKMKHYFQGLGRRSQLGVLSSFLEVKIDEPSLKVKTKGESVFIQRVKPLLCIQLIIQYLSIFPKDIHLILKKRNKSNNSLLSKFEQIEKFITLHNQLQATYFEYFLWKENTDYCSQERANNKKAKRSSKKSERRHSAAF